MKIKVFMVDDHAVVRYGISHLLGQEHDIEVVGMAATGQEAIQCLTEDTQVDVLLTDLHLGDMSGIELFEKAKTRAPGLKAILLTMETSDRWLSAAFRSGVGGYILKEVDVDELVFGIRKVASGCRFICTGLTERLSERWMIGHTPLAKQNSNIELSSREAEILVLIADGYTNLEVADKLFTSRRTVEGHRLSLLQKTGVRNTPELVKFAILNGLLPLESTH